MKNYFLLALLLLVSGLSAQIVNIPDANFKAQLLASAVNANGDGEIQNTEAEATIFLDVPDTGMTIIDMTGIEAFINLQQLNCMTNLLTSLDVSALTNLQYLDCNSNSLTSLDISGLINLQYLYCSYNSLTSLDVSGLINLQHLHCSYNSLTSLDVSALTNLIDLQCRDNLITSLDVSTLTNLQYIDCTNNLLTSLDVSALTNLRSIVCAFNSLTSLDVSALTNLEQLYCGSNSITSLDVSASINLWTFHCAGNLLTSLDVTNCSRLIQFYFSYNPSLTTVYMKNGLFNSTSANPFAGTSLQYICVDVEELLYYQNAPLSGLTNLSINTFCSFPLGGNYNTVSGTSIYDGNTNGCTITDNPYLFLNVAFTDGINTSYGCTDNGGNYIVFLDSGNFTFTPQLQNMSYFSVSPNPANIYFPNDSNNLQIQDFCITPNGIFPDVEIALMPTTPARPGFDAEYQLLFHNKGTTTVSGDITVDFMGNKMTFISASQAISAQTANEITWSYSNLQPSESRTITFTMNILPPPTNDVGDMLNFTANIPLANDADGYDNYCAFTQNIVNACDPNDKTCLEGNLVNNAKIGDYLHYLIRFQNTGNYPADHVVIVDSINVNQFDIASLQILETSHNAHISVNQAVLQFYFEDIQLADSFSNEPESHGYVLFKIKTKANLPQNSSVNNKAEIYFDYNLPIITNTETTTFADIVSLANGIQKPHFQLYPNPAQNSLTIETEKSADFVILNVMGEMLISKHIEGKQILDISMLPKGIYFIQEKNTNLGQLFIRE